MEGEKALSRDALLGIPVLTLAYEGDAVYELMVRTRLSRTGFKPGKLNAEALRYVSAPAQAEAAGRLLPLFTEEEKSVYLRARNARVSNIPHGATVEQYHAATGLEAVFGWLWLSGAEERVQTLFDAAFSAAEG